MPQNSIQQNKKTIKIRHNSTNVLYDLNLAISRVFINPCEIVPAYNFDFTHPGRNDMHKSVN